MCELPTMMTSLTTMGGRADADLAERRIDADRAVGAGLRHLVPRLARPRLARRRRVADDERTGVVDGERDQRKSEPVHQVDDAVLAELGIGQARLGVERRQVIARRDDDDALARAVGPVGRPAAGELTRRLLPADAFVHPPHPERLAVLGIDRGRHPARAWRP